MYTHHCLRFIILGSIRCKLVIVLNQKVDQLLLWLRETFHRQLEASALNVMSWEWWFLANFKFENNGVHLKQVLWETLHDLVELDFVVAAKDGEQVGRVCIDKLPACVLSAIDAAHSKNWLRWSLATSVFGLVRLLESVWLDVLPEGPNNLSTSFFLDGSAEDSLQLWREFVFLRLMIRMHAYSADERFSWTQRRMILSLNWDAVKLVTVLNFGLDPIYRLINMIISRKLNFDFLEIWEHSEKGAAIVKNLIIFKSVVEFTHKLEIPIWFRLTSAMVDLKHEFEHSLDLGLLWRCKEVFLNCQELMVHELIDLLFKRTHLFIDLHFVREHAFELNRHIKCIKVFPL